MPKYIVAITGASGVIYGVKLAAELLSRDFEVHLVCSEAAHIVMEKELPWIFENSLEATLRKYLPEGKLFFYANDAIASPIASGSYITDGMIIIPCTMATVSSLANGSSRSLLERAADVILKEKRSLIMVPRETPLSSIHLRNMLTLSEMGVQIIPAMPAFYHQPQSIDDMVNFVVGKVLDAMHIPHDIFLRYK
ncbi:MAG: UbiX family flavin prenyltransferase [Syntrophomonadaceae bacterium]|nr:UbiX family flavin prenyltransferase [Syntrophomonadaceae bacterium]